VLEFPESFDRLSRVTILVRHRSIIVGSLSIHADLLWLFAAPAVF